MAGHSNLSANNRALISADLSDLSLRDAKVAVVGRGAYGSFVVNTLTAARESTEPVGEVVWLTRDQDIADRINTERRNDNCNLSESLREIELTEQVRATANHNEAMSQADFIVLAAPSDAIPELIPALKLAKPNAVIISTVKSIMPDRGAGAPETPLQYLRDKLGRDAHLAFFGGPGFAKDLIKSGSAVKRLMAASEQPNVAERVAELFTGEDLVVKAHGAAYGVEAGCAMKNFGALLMGVANGLSLSEREKSHLFHEAYLEMLQVIQAVDTSRRVRSARVSGVHADLFLTSTGESRNVRMGEALVEKFGEYSSPEEISSSLKLTAEGVNATRGALAVGATMGLQLPLVGAMSRILDGGHPSKEIFRTLDAIGKLREARRTAHGSSATALVDLQEALLGVFPIAKGILDGMQAAPQEKGLVFNLGLRELRRGAKLFRGGFQKDVLAGDAHESLFRIFDHPEKDPVDRRRYGFGRSLGMGVSREEHRRHSPHEFGDALRVVECAWNLYKHQSDVRSRTGDTRITLPFLTVMRQILVDGVPASWALREMIRDESVGLECRPQDYTVPLKNAR